MYRTIILSLNNYFKVKAIFSQSKYDLIEKVTPFERRFYFQILLKSKNFAQVWNFSEIKLVNHPLLC